MNLLTGIAIVYGFALNYGHSEFALWDYANRHDVNTQYITSDFKIGVEWGKLYVGGGLSVPTVNVEGKLKAGSFNPVQSSYDFTAGIKNDHFDVGYAYTCNHPIMIYLDDYTRVGSRVEGAYWKVFVKFNGEFRPFQ